MKLKYYLSSPRIMAIILYSILFLILLISSANGAVPTINSHNNTKSGTDRWAIVAVNEVIGFNITATGATSYNWAVDGASQNRNSTNFSTSWTGWFGSPHYIVASATNGDGSSTYEYRVGISKTIGNTQIASLNESAYNEIRNATRTYDLKMFIGGTIMPYTNIAGNIFYLFVYLVIFSMYWIRQGSITVPSVLGLIVGGAMIGMLPEEYQTYAIAIIAIAGGALLMKLSSESR